MSDKLLWFGERLKQWYNSKIKREKNKPKAVVVIFPGTNCDNETAHALWLSGFNVEKKHINRLLEGSVRLNDYKLLTLAGGFSYGDDLASGKVASNRLKKLGDEFYSFTEKGLVLGICNGFQILVKSGVLPDCNESHEQTATLFYNDIGHFRCDWVHLKNPNPEGPCIFTKDLEHTYYPVAHGEGKFYFEDGNLYDKMVRNKQIVFKYVNPLGEEVGYPYNPNGSLYNIAGVCNPDGRIFGLMPHPERALYPENHPQYPAEKRVFGRKIFQNAAKFARKLT
jgi:phosphoribosylformylglycinamidine synthase